MKKPLSLSDYSIDWIDYETMEEAFKIADTDGVETAYKLYMEGYMKNCQKSGGEIQDYNHKGKYYKYESMYQGWSSEDFQGTIRIYDVNSSDSAIGIAFVENILSVLCNGKDITSDCYLVPYPADRMIIPLEQSEINIIEFRIDVTCQWWRVEYPRLGTYNTYLQPENTAEIQE